MPDDAHEKTNLHQAIWSQDCETHYPRLLSYAWYLSGDGHSAGDIVQDVVTKILRLVPDPEPVEDRLSYLLRAVRNRWADWLRETRRLKTISLDDPNNKELHTMAAPEKDDDRDSEANEYSLALQSEVERLEGHEKDVFTLYLEGLKCSEIAAELGEHKSLISYELNVIRNRVLKRLQRRFKEQNRADSTED